MKKMFLKLPMGLRMVVIALIYAIILISHIGIVYFYNNNVAEIVDSKEIVVAINEIPIHTVIDVDDVELKRVKLDNILPGAYENIEDVIGKEAQVKLVMNDQIHESKISEKVKEEGELIVELPQEWVISFPKSLRRYDKISILPIEKEDSNKNANLYGSDSEEALKKESERKAKAEKLLMQVEDKLSGISVVYFKDNTANDITDQAPNVTTNSDTPRVTASNLGTRLEIAVTPEEWGIIQGLYEVNYKFVVGYQ